MGTMKRFPKWVFLALLIAAILIAKRVGGSHSEPVRTVEVVPSTIPEDEKPLQVLQVVSSMQAGAQGKPKLLKADWHEDLRLDHLCDLVQHLDEVSPAERAQALMDGPGNVKAIDTKIKAVYLETIAGHSAVPLRSQGLPELDFYNALAAANLLSGSFVKNVSADAGTANQLLQVLMTTDPGNGAYAFFRAKVWSGLHPELRSYPKELFLKTFQSVRFNTYYLEMLKRMHEKAFASSSYMMLSFSISASMAVPNYFESLKVLKTYIEEGDASFNRQAFQFGERLMQPALRANLDLNNTDWSMLEYGVGKAIAKAAWRVLHAGEGVPELYSNHHFTTQDEALDDLSEDSSYLTVEHCDRRGFDRLFEKAGVREAINLRSR